MARPRLDRFRQQNQGRRRFGGSSLRADRRRRADQDPVDRAVQEPGHRSGRRVRPRGSGDAQTKVTIFNTLVGHGFGKVIVGFAVKAAQKDADAFAQRIKAAVEAT